MSAINKIKKASPQQARLKVGIYGDTGSGKTYTALQIASGIASDGVLFIDTEHGSDFYADKFDGVCLEFDVIHTRSIYDVLEIFENIEQLKYDIVVLDSITHIWENAQEVFLAALELSPDIKKRERAKRGEITFFDWRMIKKPYKEMIKLMLGCNKHVIFCGRQTNEYDIGADNQPIKVGERLKSESETQYEPHILIHMRLADSKHLAIIEKDRSGLLQDKVFENPDHTLLLPVLELLRGEKQPAIPDSVLEDVGKVKFEDEEDKVQPVATPPVSTPPVAQDAPTDKQWEVTDRQREYLTTLYTNYNYLFHGGDQRTLDMLVNQISSMSKQEVSKEINRIKMIIEKKKKEEDSAFLYWLYQATGEISSGQAETPPEPTPDESPFVVLPAEPTSIPEPIPTPEPVTEPVVENPVPEDIEEDIKEYAKEKLKVTDPEPVGKPQKPTAKTGRPVTEKQLALLAQLYQTRYPSSSQELIEKSYSFTIEEASQEIERLMSLPPAADWNKKRGGAK